MPPHTPVYVVCLGCEAAVRELSCEPCPNCARCAFCGRRARLSVDADLRCGCRLDEDAETFDEVAREHGIPEDRLPRERRRLEIRRRLDRLEACAAGTTGVIAGFLFALCRSLAQPAWLSNGFVFTAASVTVSVGTMLLVVRFFRGMADRRLDDEEFEASTALEVEQPDAAPPSGARGA